MATVGVMLRRLLTPLLLAAAVVAAGASCTPEPEPTPTPTGFASADEAFAAAEQTYRAYVDALNAVDLADPATFQPVYDWLTGDALSSSKESLTQMHADGWTVVGETTFSRATLAEHSPDTVVLDLCLDVTDIDVVDASGVSVVPADRTDVQALRVSFSSTAITTTGLRVATSSTAEELTCTP